MPNPKMYVFEVSAAGDSQAGIPEVSDIVRVIFDSGNPGLSPGDFEQEFVEFLESWYDGHAEFKQTIEVILRLEQKAKAVAVNDEPMAESGVDHTGSETA